MRIHCTFEEHRRECSEEQVVIDHQDGERTAMMTGCQSLGLRGGSPPGAWRGETVAESISEPTQVVPVLRKYRNDRPREEQRAEATGKGPPSCVTEEDSTLRQSF